MTKKPRIDTQRESLGSAFKFYLHLKLMNYIKAGLASGSSDVTKRLQQAEKKNGLLNLRNFWLLPSLTNSMQVWLIYGSWDGRLSRIIQLEGPKCNHTDSCKKRAERIVLHGTDGGVKTQQEMLRRWPWRLQCKAICQGPQPLPEEEARQGSSFDFQDSSVPTLTVTQHYWLRLFPGPCENELLLKNFCRFQWANYCLLLYRNGNVLEEA